LFSWSAESLYLLQRYSAKNTAAGQGALLGLSLLPVGYVAGGVLGTLTDVATGNLGIGTLLNWVPGLGKADEVVDGARAATQGVEEGVEAVARGVTRFTVDLSGQTRIFLRGGTLEVSEHAAQRITQRGLTLDAVESVVTHQQSFRYFHEGAWKTGYYDPISRVFVGTADNMVTTVINNATPKYIQNLQELQP
jgi:hypothetical protein